MLNMPKNMKVTTLQFPASKRYQENLDKLLSDIYKHRDSEIIVAPEVCLSGMDLKHLETASKFSIMALKVLKKKIDKQILILTIIVKKGDYFINRAVVIHNHKVVYKQDKSKLFKLGDEDLYFLAGKEKAIAPFEIDGVKYAILICFEIRFKHLWQQIDGADIVIIPARWGILRKSQLEILSKALAVLNQCYVVVSNANDKDMASSSAIISPMGDTVSDDNIEAIDGEIDFREIKKMRRYIVVKD